MWEWVAIGGVHLSSALRSAGLLGSAFSNRVLFPAVSKAPNLELSFTEWHPAEAVYLKKILAAGVAPDDVLDWSQRSQHARRKQIELLQARQLVHGVWRQSGPINMLTPIVSPPM